MISWSTDILLCHQQSWNLLTIIFNMSEEKHTGYDLKSHVMYNIPLRVVLLPWPQPVYIL